MLPREKFARRTSKTLILKYPLGIQRIYMQQPMARTRDRGRERDRTTLLCLIENLRGNCGVCEIIPLKFS